MVEFIGEIAAILTALLWTINSILFTLAGKKIGAFCVNAYRIIIATIFVSITHLIIFGTVFPQAGIEQWFWIGLSGIIGLGIGDFGLFSAFVLIGPRLSVLVMALSPIFASIGAYIILGELLSVHVILGITITLAGVILAVLEKESEVTWISKRSKGLGLLLALIGAGGQGIGVVLAKKGMFFTTKTILNPLTVTLMRVIIGAIFIWSVLVVIGKLPELKRNIRNKTGLKYTTAGAFVGPFIGVTLSMVAIAYTQTGIAQTLMSLMPVMIIPLTKIAYNEKTKRKGILGAIMAVIGVAILFQR